MPAHHLARARRLRAALSSLLESSALREAHTLAVRFHRNRCVTQALQESPWIP